MAFDVVDGNSAMHFGHSSTSSIKGPRTRHKTVTYDPSVGKMLALIVSNVYCGQFVQKVDLKEIFKNIIFVLS
jgi:hypothetical protein